MANVADRIAAARRGAGLSQAQLAERAGTSQPAVNRYERGRSVPSPSTLGRLLEACRPGRRPREALIVHRAEVVRLLENAGASTVLVFGSVARDEDRPDSDVDLLVDHLDPENYSWGEPKVKTELERLLGFPVHLGQIDDLRPSVAQEALKDARPL